jgi:hypothetical protein
VVVGAMLRDFVWFDCAAPAAATAKVIPLTSAIHRMVMLALE